MPITNLIALRKAVLPVATMALLAVISPAAAQPESDLRPKVSGWVSGEQQRLV